MLLAGIVAIAVAACGSSKITGTAADPASVVPASAPLYLGAVVTPEGSLKQNTVADAKAITHLKNPFGRLVGAIERSGRFGHFNYERDVKPWLGPNLGLFATSTRALGRLSEALGESLAGSGSPEAILGNAGSKLLGGGAALEGALVLDTIDLAEARAFIARLAGSQGAHQARYHGVAYEVNSHGQAEGIVGRFAVIGGETALRDVIETEQGGSSLAGESSGPYAKLAAKGPSQALITIYANPYAANLAAQIADEYRSRSNGATQSHGGSSGSEGGTAAELPSLLGLLGSQPSAIMASVVPHSGSIALDADLLSSASGESQALTSAQSAAQLVGTLPGESWLAAGVGDVGAHAAGYLHALRGVAGIAATTVFANFGGPALQSLLAHLDSHASAVQRIFSGWAGPGAVFAAGTGILNLQAGMVIESSDPARSRAAVAQLSDALRAAGATVKPTSIPGAQAAAAVVVRGLPLMLDIGAGSGRFAIGLGPASVQSALAGAGAGATPLSSSPTYSAASSSLGGLKPTALISFPTMLALLEGVGLTSSPSLSSATPYLRSVDLLSAGTQGLGGGITRVQAVLQLQKG